MRKEKGMLVISIGPSEQDDENARLQQIAHDAGRVKKTPGRGPDLVLMDGMDDEHSPQEVFDSYEKQKEYEAGFGHTKGLQADMSCLTLTTLFMRCVSMLAMMR